VKGGMAARRKANPVFESRSDPRIFRTQAGEQLSAIFHKKGGSS